MTDLHRFKIAVLDHCASKGLTVEESLQWVIQQREKVAAGPAAAAPSVLGFLAGLAGKGAEKLVTAPIDVAKTLAPYAAGAAATAAIGLPVAAGIGGGLMLANVGQNPHAIEEAKARELVSEYKRLADEARRASRLKKMRTLGAV